MEERRNLMRAGRFSIRDLLWASAGISIALAFIQMSRTNPTWHQYAGELLLVTGVFTFLATTGAFVGKFVLGTSDGALAGCCCAFHLLLLLIVIMMLCLT